MGAEIDYNELFGVPADTGAEVTEPAEPSNGNDVEGAEAGEVADPSEEEPGTPAGEDGSGEGSGSADGGQSAEDNARYAAARRAAEAERDAAVARARQEAQQQYEAQMTEFFRKAGLTDSFTGKPITSMDEFNSWNQRFQDEKLQKDLKAGKLTAEQISQVVGNHPIVKQAQQVIQQNEKVQQEARQKQAKANIEAQVQEIAKLDPEIKDLESLLKSEGYDKVYGYVKQGYALADAYKLAHFERLSQRSAAAARQQALNSVAGKNHMVRTPAKGNAPETVQVPKEILEQYRLFMPKATDAEIRAHYAKSIKK